MASESFLTNHWEKLLFVASLILVGAVLMMASGSYFQVDDPSKDVEAVESDYDVVIAVPKTPVAPPALVGVESFTTRMGGADAPDIRQYTFYDYQGFELEELAVAEEQEFRLPKMALEATSSSNTGDIEIRWKRDETAQRYHPKPSGLGGRQAEFDLVLMRQDLAEEAGSAVEVFRGAAYELTYNEELGVEPRGGVAAIQPGRTYRYYLELEIRDGLKLVPGASQTMTSSSAQVTTPVRYSFDGLLLPPRGQKEVTVGVLGKGPSVLKVRSTALTKGAPIPVPEAQQEEVGTTVLPFRPIRTGILSRNRPLSYYNLQRAFFGIHYPVQQISDPSGGAPPGGGGGAEKGEGGMEKNGQPPGQPEDKEPGQRDESTPEKPSKDDGQFPPLDDFKGKEDAKPKNGEDDAKPK